LSLASSRGNTNLRSVARLLQLTALLTIVGVTQTYFATGGVWRYEMGFNYFDQLGQAFLAGQLYLSTEPSPELTALPDPWDPVQNEAVRLHDPLHFLHDASYYHGHYYLYWGPIPSLIHAAIRVLTHQAIADSMIDVFAGVLSCLGFWLILDRVRARLVESPAWLVWGSSLAFGVGGITLFLEGRPSIYHESLLIALARLIFPGARCCKHLTPRHIGIGDFY
jgi:hypothetical protein